MKSLENLKSAIHRKDFDALPAILLQLTAENRSLIASSRGIKRKLEEFKKDLDSKHLCFTNLQYEKFYYQGEISSVESYDSIYQNIPLLPLDKYLADHPNASNDVHSLNIERLNFELTERKRLVSVVQDLNTVKEKLEKIKTLKQMEIKKLDLDFDALISNTIPLQDQIGSRLTKRRREDIQAKLLPDCLIMLYNKIQDYNDGVDSKISWDITGDKDLAKLWKPSRLEHKLISELKNAEGNDTSLLVEEEEVNQESSRLTLKGSNYYSRHPLELNIKLLQKNSVILKMSWVYFDKLGIVGVHLTGEKNASLQDLPPSFVLCDLFLKEDDGAVFPLQDCNIDGFTFDLNGFGLSRPFIWAQSICELTSGVTQISFHDMVGVISKRWESLKFADDCISSLKQGKLVPSDTSLHGGSILSFKLAPETGKSLSKRIFLITMSMLGNQYQFCVEISASYPQIIPSWSCINSDDSDERRKEISEKIQDVVGALGTLCFSEPGYSICFQVSKLMESLHSLLSETKEAPIENKSIEESVSRKGD